MADKFQIDNVPELFNNRFFFLYKGENLYKFNRWCRSELIHPFIFIDNTSFELCFNTRYKILDVNIKLEEEMKYLYGILLSNEEDVALLLLKWS